MKGRRLRFILIPLLICIGLVAYSSYCIVGLRSSFIYLRSFNLRTLSMKSPGLCSLRATHRGFNQHVITVSLFGPKENSLFQRSRSLLFLHDMIQEARQVYPGWFLRIYHDNTIDEQLVHTVERQHNHIDFCSMANFSFLPPRMWRYLPIGDLLVDVSKYSLRTDQEQCVENGETDANLTDNTNIITKIVSKQNAWMANCGICYFS